MPEVHVLRKDFGRHWTPIHLDFVVDDLDAAVERAVSAGATIEREVDHPGSEVARLPARRAEHTLGGVCISGEPLQERPRLMSRWSGGGVGGG
jgi:hypothetical protein